jgi:murein DD-endopeptidase MepM/ murein hydrolase activator NlpD
MLPNRSGVLAGILLLLSSGLCEAGGGGPTGFRLSLPVDCEIGADCWLQNYVDVDPGPGVRDWTCGSASYNGHKGVDFRLLSAAESRRRVGVMAVADGTVKGVRNDMRDVFAVGVMRDSIKGRECGNGLVVAHAGGWETQYCHMLQGSIVVAPGQRVKRGQKLGAIGFSGLVEFSHLHLGVRRGGKYIDPFTGQFQNGACTPGAAASSGLWTAKAARVLPYRNSQIIDLRFSGAPPDLRVLEIDHAAAAVLTPRSDHLILFARLVNVRVGDKVRLHIKGPSGLDAVSVSAPFKKAKATTLVSSGGKRTVKAWPPGLYIGTAQVLRGGNVVGERAVRFKLSR